MLEQSILKSTKKALGVDTEDPSFDQELIMHINSVFTDLVQLGVGPVRGFAIQSDAETWDTFLGDDLNLNHVQTYMYFRLRLIFDPPPTSFAIAAMEKQARELEFRLNVHSEETRWVDPRPPVLVDEELF